MGRFLAAALDFALDFALGLALGLALAALLADAFPPFVDHFEPFFQGRQGSRGHR
jgi:hypothetical protein